MEGDPLPISSLVLIVNDSRLMKTVRDLINETVGNQLGSLR